MKWFPSKSLNNSQQAVNSSRFEIDMKRTDQLIAIDDYQHNCDVCYYTEFVK